MKIINIDNVKSNTYNGITSYSGWGVCEYKGQSGQALIQAYKQDLLKVGEYDDIKHGIKMQKIDKKDGSGQFTKFTIYAEKKEYNDYKKHVEYTLDDAAKLLKWCEDQKTTAEAVELFKVMTVMGIKIQTLADKIKNDFDGKEIKEDVKFDNTDDTPFQE